MSKVREERACQWCKESKPLSDYEPKARVCNQCKGSPVKKCTTCGNVKARSEFWEDRTKCVSCLKEYNQDKYYRQVARRATTKASHPDYIPPDAPKALPEEPPRVFNILPIPKERANTKGELRQGPAKDPAIPKFAPKGVYGIAAFWADHPEAHRAWYEVLREDNIPVSDKRYVHPMLDR